MIEWIIKNKDWLFSGTGIIIFVYFIKFLYWLLSRNKSDEYIQNIARRYLEIIEGKISGHSGITGLIESGATGLTKNEQLLKVCDIIVQNGKPNPLDSWLLKHLDKKEALKFLKWQYKNKIGYAPYYFNENTFIKLVKMYKSNNP